VAAAAAAHLRVDEFEFQLGVGHVLVISDQRPAERQRVGNHLAKCADPDAHDVHVATVGVWLDHVGDRFAQRQLMHGWHLTGP
jgi:hypothetical protein